MGYQRLSEIFCLVERSPSTDHYTAPIFGEQCGVDKQPLTDPAGKLFPRNEDAAFAKANLAVSSDSCSYLQQIDSRSIYAQLHYWHLRQQQVTFPTSVVAADSWWRYDPKLDVFGDEYQVRLQKVNAALIAAGVDSCPTKCMSLNPRLGGCNETSRCGVPYVRPVR